MMFYKNTKVMIHSLDGDTGFFDIVAGVLQGDTLALNRFILYLDSTPNVDIYNKKKARSRRYPAETITDEV